MCLARLVRQDGQDGRTHVSHKSECVSPVQRAVKGHLGGHPSSKKPPVELMMITTERGGVASPVARAEFEFSVSDRR